MRDFYVDTDGEVYEYVSVDNDTGPDAQYFMNLYGTCSLSEKCVCLRPGKPWLGVLCGEWKPLGVKSHEELMKCTRYSLVTCDA